MESLSLLGLIAGTLVLAGLVKGVIGGGLPSITIGVLSLLYVLEGPPSKRAG